MKIRIPAWWPKYKTPLVVILLIVGLLALYLLAEAGYTYPWTGFGPYTPPQPPIEGYQREKTTWDWLQLLIIPIVLAVGGFFLNRTERLNAERATNQRAKIEREIADRRAEIERRIAKTRARQEREIANQRAQDAVLDMYLDQISELLIDKNLLKSQPTDEARAIARIRTLTALRRLDGGYNKILTQFLHDAGLFGEQSTSVIDMSKANLRGADLHEANLRGTRLDGADLHEANLRGARLDGADLSKSNLQGANLQGTRLQGANLQEANLQGAALGGANLSGTNLLGASLQGANLQGATLGGADLRVANLQRADLRRAFLRRANLYGADLSGANLQDADLQDANLQGATMPDGSKHP